VTLTDVLTVAAEEAAVEVDEEALDDGATGWAVGGRLIATVDADGRAAEFRLEPLLAGAARRTPDTSASQRGPEWVVFAPVVLDDHAIDRAEAWFGAAVRRAAAGRG
jgi:hypothetical protein